MKNGNTTSGENAGQPATIQVIAAKLNIPADILLSYGRDKAKIPLSYLADLDQAADGKLILVTAMTPTKYGEGKTATSIGLGDGLSRLGESVAICLREPSLGPVFGMKGGGTGGGKASIIPSNDINMHFTGDLHAISSAHNLLSAMVDNHIYWDNELDIDPTKITWPRVMDMNDRALRDITLSVSRKGKDLSHQAGFDITAASEVMAIFSLSSDAEDLMRRLGNIVIGQDRKGSLITAKQLNAEGAMAALLSGALDPNLVQSREGTPTLVHGGPFANIAHGCSSVIASKAGLKLADYVITEAGFGADLGAEKFFNIKCRAAGLWPSATVMVATIRALKAHGGVDLDDIEAEDISAVMAGAENLKRQIEIVRSFGQPVIVALNRFAADTENEISAIRDFCAAIDVAFSISSHFAEGGKGAEDLARKVMDLAEEKSPPKFGYELTASLEDKLRAVAQNIYGAAEISFSEAARQKLAQLGNIDLPVCIAKTQYSFSTDPKAIGAPAGHTIEFSDIRLSAGAGFVVAVAGNMMTMPGLPRTPSAKDIGVDASGAITGIN
ncbi:MAG: formate--tetrahydrofolate ligase [Rhodospirillaceae bacterium]|jgi:formate--tetrahydrofolate ligase|nr:formate--tetrahydrofolate ligase [Rhodospirillaceae bacterium]MBT7268849.1 formate--tetrahydrofolate ligase [Rhodospirillaceae bacterium]